MVKLTDNIRDNFPFISVVHYGGTEYVGIIANQDQYVTSMYNYEGLKTNEEKQKFLELGEIWWWESNRITPINLFLKKEVEPYKYCLMTLSSKDVTLVFGPTINLSNMAVKRVKRKMIQLIRKPR